MRTTIVQLTDLHIRRPGELVGGRVDTALCLRRAVSRVRQLSVAVDAVVITGDLADGGAPAEYTHLRALLAALECPVYLLAGNHDDVAALRSVFENDYLGSAGDVRYSVGIGAIQLLAVDTTVPGQPHGVLDGERLEWIARALHSGAGRPVIVAMHHPPFATLIGHMDEMALLQGRDELEALLRSHPNVERVICGHVHRPVQARFGGTIASICPSTAHQVALDLCRDSPGAWTLEPGAFQLHVWEPGSGLVTHQVYSDDFAGPYPFDG